MCRTTSPPGEGGGEGAIGDSSNPAALVPSATAVGVRTDQSGNPTVYTFDIFGNPTCVENALGNTTVYERDPYYEATDSNQIIPNVADLVTEMYQPPPAVGDTAPETSFGYDSRGNMTFVGTPDGARHCWVYTIYTTPGGKYDVPIEYIDGLNHETDYAYSVDGDGSGPAELRSVTQIGDATTGNPVTSYTYTTLTSPGESCPTGLLASETDPNGHATSYTYYTSGNDAGLVEQIDYPTDAKTPASHEWFQYDSADNLTYHTDVLGSSMGDPANTTTYGYDALGRKVSETDPPNASGQTPQTTWTYNAMGNVTTESVLQAVVDSGTNQIWETTTYTYTSLEQLYQVSAPGPNNSGAPALTTYNYTPTGQLYKVTDADNGTTTYGYDAIGQQTSVSLPDPATGAAGGPTTTYAYDAIGRLISETDAKHNSTNFSYAYVPDDNYTEHLQVTTTAPSPDGVAAPLAVTDVYDADGHLIQEYDSVDLGADSLNETAYQYDALGRPGQVQSPSGVMIGPTYDKMGNMVSNTDAEGNVTTYVYDARNRVIASYAPTAGSTFAQTASGISLLPDPGEDPSAWTQIAGGYTSGNPNASASYNFTGLTPGTTYEVLATWAGGANNTQHATYNVTSGGSDSVEVNQTRGSTGDTTGSSGGAWQCIMSLTATADTATIALSNSGSTGSTLFAGGVKLKADSVTPTPTLSEGDWSPDGNGGYQTTSTDATATYGFSGLTPGETYEVQCTSTADPYNAPDATYSVSSGGDDVGTAAVSQQSAPVGDAYGPCSLPWQRLLTFTARADGTASVTLGGADGTRTLLADGVQIEAARPKTTYTYDTAGDLLTETDPLGNVTKYTYDARGNQTGATLPDPATGDNTNSVHGAVTSYTYDLLGNLLSTTSPSPANPAINVTTVNTYDQQNNAVSSLDGNGNVTSYTYDPLRNMLSLTDTDGNSTYWSYDHLGQKTSQSSVVALGYNADGTINTTTAASYAFYDANGNPTTSIDADGRSIAYQYSHLNQETGETWYDASGAVTGTVSCGYNSLGYMTSASNTVGTSTLVSKYDYKRDLAGNVTAENVQLPGASTNVALQATYDYNGDRTALSAAIGVTPTFDGNGYLTGFFGGTNDFVNTYSYNSADQMTGITQTSRISDTYNDVTAKSVSLSYDNDGRPTALDRYQSADGSNLVSHAQYGYDHDSQLTDLTYNTQTNNLGAVLVGYHWNYNAAGAVTDFYSHNDSSATPPQSTYVAGSSSWGNAHYSYDPNAQLTGATYANFSTAQTPPSSFTQSYDPNGNRSTVVPALTTTTTTGTDNRLLFDGTYFYSYDAEGNRTARYQNSHDPSLDSYATNVTTYTWDNANELTSVTTSGATVSYAYDSFGRMVSRTDASGTENLVYDGQNIGLVLNSGGQVIERNLTGLAADEVFATEMVATVASGTQAAGTVNWLLADNQGTVRDVVQYSGTLGAVVDHLVYSAFGQLLSQSNSTPADQPAFTYNGAWEDPQTKLDKMGLRWYDAVDAVFASQDPIGFWGGDTNLSRFVGNSAPNAIDPLGLAPVAPTVPGGLPPLGGQGVGNGDGWVPTCCTPHFGIRGTYDAEDIDGMGPAEGDGTDLVVVNAYDDVPPVCFAAGTRVLMADGSTKPIEQIQRGDRVRAASHQDPEGPISDGEVVETYHHQPRNLVEVEVGGEVIRSTPRHPFYVRGRGFTAVEQLEPVDELRTASGGWAAARSVIRNGHVEPVYNFNVAGLHTYFVRSGGVDVLVHNDSGADTSTQPSLRADNRTWWQRFKGDLSNLWNVPPSDYSGNTSVPDQWDNPVESTTRHIIHYVIYPAKSPYKTVYAGSHASDAQYQANITYAGQYLRRNAPFRGAYVFGGSATKSKIPRVHVGGEGMGVAGYSIDEGAYWGGILCAEREVGPVTVAGGVERTWSQSSGWHTEPIIIGDFQLSKKGGVGIYLTPGADEGGIFIYVGNPQRFYGGGFTGKPSVSPNLINPNYWNGTLPAQ